jgi:hypothetical protein
MSDLLLDEAWYRSRYPDIEEAVRNNKVPSGRFHYLKFGRQEGRSAYRFDPAWYSDAYPMVGRDIARGRASDPQEHYERHGRFRGYLPFAGAPRREGFTAQRARARDLWVDLPNADDIVVGRRDAGLITSARAALLSDFIANGFVVLREAITPATIAWARYDLAKAYLGCDERQQFVSGVGDDLRTAPWCPATNDGPAAAKDIHCLSPAIREMIFNEQVVSVLRILFDSPPIVFASKACLRGCGTPYGTDALRWPMSRPRQLAGALFALEQGEPGACSFACRPGSHRLIESPGAFSEGKHNVEAAAVDTGECDGADALGLPTVPDIQELVLSLNCGDVVLWSAGLWHVEQPPTSLKTTRRSVAARYCPSYAAPLSWEEIPPQIAAYCDQGYYTARTSSSPPLQEVL